MVVPSSPGGSPQKSSAIQYSEVARVALSGGQFDARSLLKRPRPTGDEEEDDRLTKIFHNKIKLLDVLNQREDLVEGARDWTENKMLGITSASKAAAEARKSPTWPGTYMYLEKVAKYWRADWVIKHFARYGASEQWVLALDASSNTGIMELTDFPLAQHGKMKLPRAMLDKEINDGVWVVRLQKFGRLSEEWLKLVTNNFEMPPKLYWGKPKAGCYWVERAADGKFLIVHITGDKAPAPSYWTIDVDNIRILDNAYDFQAALLLGDDPNDKGENLAKRFAKGKGPWRSEIVDAKGALYKEMAEGHAKKAQEEKDRLAKAAAAGPRSIAEDIESQAKKRKSDQAKLALQKRMPKRKVVATGSIVQAAEDPLASAQPLGDGGAADAPAAAAPAAAAAAAAAAASEEES
ncbi:unnamed protein product [Prorocentrum cordatum]|uniref:START domain-containing protein n=1 Tax=Prorocentrum cordatum TaxID=2364126 RepID=A0ABN9XGH7_9DINO|nr:unnamed protein product [Polarella glacialis]